MADTLNHRDILLCWLASQRRLATGAQMEAAIRQQWAEPQRSLLELLAEHAQLSEQQTALLGASVEREAAATRAGAVASRLRSLPSEVRRLVAEGGSDVVLATDARFDTRPADSENREAKAAVLASLTPGERFDIQHVHAQGD